MGLQDKTLLPLLISLARNAIRDFIPWPEILLLDLMCHLHQMGSMEVTPDELWNYIMEPIRRHLNDPRNQTKTVWISVDKRYVPKLKQSTSSARDARAKAVKESEGEGEEEEEQKQSTQSLPYPPHTQVDEFGRVIFVKLLGSTTNLAPHYQIAGWPEGNKLVLSRLCSSRELRYKVFVYMFTKLAPLESKNLPKGTRLIISFSDDHRISPVIVDSDASKQTFDYDVPNRFYFANRWSEADHDQPNGLTALLVGTGAPRSISVLACSVDSDMYGIWTLFVTHLKNSIWVNSGLQIYFWNMNPVKDGPNARVVEMVQFSKDLEKGYGVGGPALAAFKHVLGNDYANKKALTPRVSAEKAWPRFVRYIAQHGKEIGPIIDSPDTLAKFLRFLATDPDKGREEKAVTAAVANKAELANQLVRIHAGLRLWRQSFCQSGPDEGDEWLQPVKPGQKQPQQHKEPDVVMVSASS